MLRAHEGPKELVAASKAVKSQRRTIFITSLEGGKERNIVIDEKPSDKYYFESLNTMQSLALFRRNYKQETRVNKRQSEWQPEQQQHKFISERFRGSAAHSSGANFTLALLLMPLMLHLASGSTARLGPSDRQSAVSMRQVLVPVFHTDTSSSGARNSVLPGEKHDSPNHQQHHNIYLEPLYSPNNRGFHIRSRPRFGERVGRTSHYSTWDRIKKFTGTANSQPPPERHANVMAAPAPFAWSQPDPRISYSAPLKLEPQQLEAPQLAGSEQSRLSSSSEQQSTGVKGYLAKRQLANTDWRLISGAAASRRSSSSQVGSTTTPAVSMKRGEDSNDIVSATTQAATSSALNSPNSSVAPLEEEEEWLASWRAEQTQQHGANEAKLSSGHGAGALKPQLIGAASGSNMITLIRYLPVLFNVPADQVALSGGTRRPSGASTKLPTAPGTASASETWDVIAAGAGPAPLTMATKQPTLGYYRLYRPPYSPPQAETAARLVRYQVASEQLEPHLAARPALLAGHPGETLAGQQSSLSPSEYGPMVAHEVTSASGATGILLQPAASAALVAAGPQQASGTLAASKAISGYASKLISMLRPSSLLSSMGSGGVHAHQSSAYYPLASQAQIYLLAPGAEPPAAVAPVQPAPGFAYATTTRHPLVGHQSRPEDLLLNQASKLHSSATSTAAAGKSLDGGRVVPVWSAHQQSNGLICVHGFIQSPSSAAKLVPPSHESGSTIAPPQTQLEAQDHSSFDYLPASSEASKQSGALATKQVNKPKGGQRGAARESPVKLAHKLSKKLKLTPGPAAEQQLVSDAQASTSAPPGEDWPGGSTSASPEVQEHEHHHQQRLLGSPSESRSSVANDLGEQHAASKGNLSRLQQRHRGESISGGGGGHRRTGPSRPIIPFTIKDKIDPPPLAGGSHSRPSSDSVGRHAAGQVSMAASSNPAPVQFDEPAEGELEPATLRGPTASEARPSSGWPPAQALDERRAKTSFLASSPGAGSILGKARQVTRPHQATLKSKLMGATEIDYSKEAASSSGRDAGYTLPLFMASSGSAAGQGHKQDRYFSRSPPPPAEKNNGGQVTTAAEAGTELAGVASASSAVTTSSTLDGQSVTLASGLLEAPSSSEQQQQQQVSSDRQHRHGQLVRANGTELVELLVNSTRLEITTRGTPPASGGSEVPFVSQHERAQHFSFNNHSATGEAGEGGGRTNVGSSRGPKTGAKRSDKRTQEDNDNKENDAEHNVSGGNGAAASNEAEAANTSTNAYFSHDRSLSMDSSMGEFGRISESLQTNPLDLIDLQNARLSFELPPHLESLSMLNLRPSAPGQSRYSGASRDAGKSHERT